MTAPDGSYLQYTYNNARRLTTVTNNAGDTITYGYNDNGDVTSTTVKAAGGTIVKQQSALFDELGRLMRQIGASAQQYDYAYDRTDNLTQVSDPRSNLYARPARGPLLRSSRAFVARRSSTGASHRACRSPYDALSRLMRETDQESAQVNLGLDGQNTVTSTVTVHLTSRLYNVLTFYSQLYT